jgi:hypothetical protein
LLSASYRETPTTYTDSRVVPPGDVPPGGIPDFPDFPGVSDGRTEPYLSKLAFVSVRLEGQRTSAELSYSDDDREYLKTERQVDDKVTTLSVTRELSASSSLRVWYTTRDYEEDPGRDTRDWVLAARLNRELGRDLTAALETAFQATRPEDGGAAEGWWIGLRLRKDF